MSETDSVVIVGSARTAMGAFQGELSAVSAPGLGSIAIAAALERSRLHIEEVEEVLMGCVLPAGLGRAPARQAALGAGLPYDVGATTINKVCGSGMKAVMLAHDLIRADSASVIVAGGMESMSNAPYLLSKARNGYRMGHGKMLDHMFLDGLEDAYDRGRLMGTFAEDCAEAYQFTRESQDEFALHSLAKAQKATAGGMFEAEIVPVSSAGKEISSDEAVRRARLEEIPLLKPAFREGGTVTAANTSSITDGAATLCLTRASVAEQRGLTPIAKIVGHATHSQAPSLFATAPIGAIKKLCAKTGWEPGDVDLFVINEAFAVVTMATMRDLNLPGEKVNVNGGACALGHPIGASGARVLVTLLSALKKNGVRRGMASLCIGGGEATAMALELI